MSSQPKSPEELLAWREAFLTVLHDLTTQDTVPLLSSAMANEQYRATLFEIKERLSYNKGSDSSSGFGLVLCKDFLTKLGGDIMVKSKPGEGSTFTVLLPV